MSPQEELRQKVINNQVDLLVTSGSRLYGTFRETSDFDYRGFVLPGLEYLIGIYQFNEMDVPEADHKVFSLKRFIDLLLAACPQTTELLFVPKDKIVKITPIGEEVVKNRSIFLSKKIYRRLMGFSYSEQRKANGVKFEIEDKSDSDEQLLLSVRNYCRDRKFDKEEIDDIIEDLLSHHEKTLVSSLNNLGAKRKAEFEKWGYGVSSMSHAIRLTNELTELMLTGELTFPRPEAPTLKAIRQGEVSKEDANKIYDEAVKVAEKTFDKSVLPDKPDYEKAYEIYGKIVKDFLQLK